MDEDDNEEIDDEGDDTVNLEKMSKKTIVLNYVVLSTPSLQLASTPITGL